MIDLKFEIGGREVSPDRLGDELEKAILEEVASNVRRQLVSVRCPIHGAGPQVIVKGRDLAHLDFEIRGCCEALVERAVERLG